ELRICRTFVTRLAPRRAPGVALAGPAKGGKMGGRHRSGSWIAACLATAGLVALSGCGKSSHKVSAASLKSRLAPLSIAPHGFHLLRTLDWSDPVDLATEGMQAPEITHP